MELDEMISEIADFCKMLERESVLAEVPHNILEALNAIAEKPELFVVSQRNIRPAVGAYEMVESLKPTAALRSFMTAMRAWVSKSDVIDILGYPR